jgi:uncharacterized protein involved in exopolysaccharide biosynthesis
MAKIGGTVRESVPGNVRGKEIAMQRGDGNRNDKSEEISIGLADVIRSFRRFWPLYLLVIGATLGVGLAICLIQKPKYQAYTTLLPHQSKESKLGRLDALASRFGIDSPLPGMNFVDFLDPIVVSKSFLFQLSDFPIIKNGKTTLLFEYFKYPERGTGLDSLIYLTRLRSMVKLQKKASGLVEIKVTADTPEMAAGIANKLTQLVNDFAQEYNLANGRAHMSYLSTQVAEAEGNRRKAYDNLVRFMEANRGIDPMTSPSLFAKHTELKVETDIANQKYILLRNQLESAEMNLAKQDPILTVLDGASVPYFKFSPKRIQIMAIHLSGGILLAVLIHGCMLLAAPARHVYRSGMGYED